MVLWPTQGDLVLAPLPKVLVTPYLGILGVVRLSRSLPALRESGLQVTSEDFVRHWRPVGHAYAIDPIQQKEGLQARRLVRKR